METEKTERKGTSQKREPEASLFSTWQPSQKNPVICHQCVSFAACFKCVSIHTHSEHSLLLITVSIDVKCHHICCSDRFLALNDKYEEDPTQVKREKVRSGDTAMTSPGSICQYVVTQGSSARVSN